MYLFSRTACIPAYQQQHLSLNYCYRYCYYYYYYGHHHYYYYYYYKLCGCSFE